METPVKPKRKKNQSMREYKATPAYQKYKLAVMNDRDLREFKVNRMVDGENKIFWVRALNQAEAKRLVALQIPAVQCQPAYVPKGK